MNEGRVEHKTLEDLAAANGVSFREMMEAFREIGRAQLRLSAWAMKSAIDFKVWMDLNERRPQRVSLHRLNIRVGQERWTA